MLGTTRNCQLYKDSSSARVEHQHANIRSDQAPRGVKLAGLVSWLAGWPLRFVRFVLFAISSLVLIALIGIAAARVFGG